MSSPVRIAIDAMGGDNGLRSVIPACSLALQQDPQLHLYLVGDRNRLAPLLDESERVTFVHASEVVSMDDEPAQALRRKRDSSMAGAMALLADNTVEAVVSAGNTGALMAFGLSQLKTLPGISRPAICAAFPGRHGLTHMLDLGANIDCDADMLHQFALMGTALMRVLQPQQSARLGLLNIGSEAHKGSPILHAAAALLQQDQRLNYIGYVEANQLFSDCAELVVTDGFSGNVALKACEGTASYIREQIQYNFQRHWWARLQAMMAAPVLRKLQRQLDPSHYNGASLLGLRGVVVKSHGNSSVFAFSQAIKVAAKQCRANMLNDIESVFQQTL